MFNRPYYDPEDVDVSRRIKSTYTNDEGEAAIQYDDDENDEGILCVVDEDTAEAFVEVWNNAIKEDERLQKALTYHSGINAKASKELDQKDDRIKELNDQVVRLRRLSKFGRQGMSRQTELIKGLHEDVTRLTQDYESACAQMLEAEEENRRWKDAAQSSWKAIIDINDELSAALGERFETEGENRKLKAHRDQLYDHLRAILDGQMPSEDNDETAAARQLLCNEDDIEKRIHEEGYKPE